MSRSSTRAPFPRGGSSRRALFFALQLEDACWFGLPDIFTLKGEGMGMTLFDYALVRHRDSPQLLLGAMEQGGIYTGQKQGVRSLPGHGTGAKLQLKIPFAPQGR